MKNKILIASVLLCGFAHAQQGKSLDQINKEARYKTAIAAADNAILALNQLTAERQLQCERAVGNEKLCQCLSENLPYIFNFNQYIAIVSRSKEENGYQSLKADQKKAYDLVPGVRDKCVQGK